MLVFMTMRMVSSSQHKRRRDILCNTEQSCARIAKLRNRCAVAALLDSVHMAEACSRSSMTRVLLVVAFVVSPPHRIAGGDTTARLLSGRSKRSSAMRDGDRTHPTSDEIANLTPVEHVTPHITALCETLQRVRVCTSRAGMRPAHPRARYARTRERGPHFSAIFQSARKPDNFHVFLLRPE